MARGIFRLCLLSLVLASLFYGRSASGQVISTMMDRGTVHDAQGKSPDWRQEVAERFSRKTEPVRTGQNVGMRRIPI